MNPFKGKEFKQLQKEYYAKLKESGFDDIENLDFAQEPLKRWHSHYFKSRHRPAEFREIAQYYSSAKQILQSYSFANTVDRNIWEQHAEGHSVRKIASSLNIKIWVVHQCIKLIRANFMTVDINYSVNLVDVREGQIDDQDFIYATWLRPFYYDNDYVAEVDKDAFFAKYPKAINLILGGRDVTVRIACLKDDPEVILGYSVIENHKLHWVYVKKAWRQLGIATKLVPKEINTITHLTELAKRLKPREWKFDPFLF